MLSIKDDKVLNIPTIHRILTRNTVSTKYKNLRSYYYTIRPIMKWDQFHIMVKPEYSSKLDTIISEMETLFSNDIQINGKNLSVSKEPPKKQIVYSVLVLKLGIKTIKFIFYKIRDKVDRFPGWRINELILPSMINESIETLKDELEDVGKIISPNYSPRLTLKVYSKNNKTPIYIKHIKSAEQTGDERVNNIQIKTDVKFETTLGKNINLSIKKNNHPSWSSANSYSGAVSILKELIKKGIVQIPNGKNEFLYDNKTYSGLALLATPGEVKKFCFDDNTIDYIIINDFSSNDIGTTYERYGKNLQDWSVDMRVDFLYPNTNLGISDINPNVFLEIYFGSRSSTLMSNSGFKNLSVNFVPKDKIKTSTALITNLPTTIPGRL